MVGVVGSSPIEPTNDIQTHRGDPYRRGAFSFPRNLFWQPRGNGDSAARQSQQFRNATATITGTVSTSGMAKYGISRWTIHV